MYSYNSDTKAMPSEKMIFHLRDEHRLKVFTDYSYVTGSDKQFHFLTRAVWVNDIIAHCKEFNISIGSIHVIAK